MPHGWLNLDLRDAKGGMYFVDRRVAQADQIEVRNKLGLTDEPIARF